MATKAATKPLSRVSKDGKARRVEKSLSQETYLERYDRPLRRREKGFAIFPVNSVRGQYEQSMQLGLIFFSLR